MSNLFLFICACSLLVIQKCHGVLDVQLQDNLIIGVLPPIKNKTYINLEIIPKMAQYYKSKNVKGIFVAGYYGGGPAIPLDERKQLVKAWEEQANCLGFDLIVEVGAMPFVDTLEMARYCSTLNITAITAYAEVVYQATTVSEELEDMQRICDASGNKLPLLFHDLMVSDQDVRADEVLVGAMGCVSCFVGALTSINTFLDVKAAVPSIAGYQFFGFGLDNIAAALTIGMNASLTVNLFPELGYKIRDAVNHCQLDRAADIQQDLNRKMYAITNVNGGTVDSSCRTYVEQIIAAYEFFTKIYLGYRYPLEEPNSTVIYKMHSGLEALGVLSNTSDSNNYMINNESCIFSLSKGD